MDANTIQAMLVEDREEWEALLAALDARPAGRLHARESPAWNARDVYAHLARWTEHSTSVLNARLAGEAPPVLDGTDEEINARWQAADSGLGLADARERALQAFERRVHAIESVPAGRWDDELERTARADGSQHLRAHRRAIIATG